MAGHRSNVHRISDTAVLTELNSTISNVEHPETASQKIVREKTVQVVRVTVRRTMEIELIRTSVHVSW